MTGQRRRWHIYPSADELVRHVAGAVTRAAAEARVRAGRFDVVLAGGTTPRALYERLAAEHAGNARWHVWFGDERCLGVDHPDRNETMARTVWLDDSDIPAEQIHGVPPEPDPAVAARRYAAALARIDVFDLVLLGVGEDGHTASLFPGMAAGFAQDAPDALAVRDAPKPPPERITLSARRLSRARQVLVLATGAGKRDAVERWRCGDDLPVARITPPDGVDVFLDEAALPPAR